MSALVCSSLHQRTGPEERPRLVLAATVSREWELWYQGWKRLLDLVGAAGLLVVLCPVVSAIALGIKLSDGGPVLFRQVRLGRRGRRFWCYKFRTMVTNAESLLAAHPDLWDRFLKNYKLDDDPRVTRLGVWLRKTSLDELPQLWNVLRGEMSLIGPRPIVEPELSKYGEFAARLLSVKPGLGGVWQVNGRSDTSYDERVQMDMHYIDNRSLRFDLSLSIQTFLAVIRRRGAR
jgi:lipopolysaccharide/colanic/teichoic acid biosynthesis glycosyltransferase